MSGADVDRGGPVIELDGVTMRFRQHAVLRDIHLAIPRGQTLCIIGESGCGKTVMLKLMIGLLRPRLSVVFCTALIGAVGLTSALWVAAANRWPGTWPAPPSGDTCC